MDHFKVEISIGRNINVVFDPYFGRYFGWVDANILVLGYWCTNVDIFDVDSEVASSMIFVLYGAIDVKVCVDC